MPEEHYMLPALPRLPDVNDMIEGKFYFILHAPRQSGKTTFLDFLTEKINNSGDMYALSFSIDGVRNMSDSEKAINEIASLLNRAISQSPVPSIKKLAYAFDSLPGQTITTKINILLNSLCENLDKDLVVFFDEADCLHDNPLIPFLAQIRDGYNARHKPGHKFPRSVALAGMRDVRDYLRQVRPDGQSRGLASPFNIKKKALTLANFTEAEIRALYRQHTEATGQVFEDAAIAKAWHWSEGQPWLVNALADTVIADELRNDFRVTVTGDHVDQAAELLVRRRDTHIDSLLERLEETRVKNIMESVLTGTLAEVPPDSDDSRYCRDLGILALTEEKLLRPANPIYKEVIIRTLTDQIDRFMPKKPLKIWTDGKKLLMSELLTEFQAFWRKRMDARAKRLSLLEVIQYDEANHVIILFSFLQRALNSGAAIYHEYAEGRGAVDLCALYNGREYLVEVKLQGAEPLEDSLAQLSGYLDTAGEKEGWLVIFDKDGKKPLNNKFYNKTQLFNEKIINIFGC
ncbi:MAG: AAA-like domain-containing protein [Deltaproteobacteria bacterium]|nr:AAA-like domain-containing protein [Deltaproteobacteria bacterium]